MDLFRCSHIREISFLTNIVIKTFHKSTASIEVINPINSEVKMYHYQNNSLSAD